MAETEKPQTLTIGGQEYLVSELSEIARNQVVNIRITDEEIQRLNQQLAIAQTARTAYASALKAELPQKATH
ncbi:hypothetical protein [Vreelandella stevensii]|uniref:hypothetical protein n=1 Tax=Vreelandella stevensii TaxID=502821 RepID=UPI00374939CA